MNVGMEKCFNAVEKVDRKDNPKKDFYLKKIFEKSPSLVNNNLEAKVLEYKAKEYLKDTDFANSIIARAVNKAKLANPVKLNTEKYLGVVKTIDSSRRRYSERSTKIDLSELELIERDSLDPAKASRGYKKLFEASAENEDMILLADSIISQGADCKITLDKIIRQLSYNCTSLSKALEIISICLKTNETDILQKMILKSKNFVDDCSSALVMSIIAWLHSKDKQTAREYFRLAIDDYFKGKDLFFIAQVFNNCFQKDAIIKNLVDTKKFNMHAGIAFDPISIINNKMAELMSCNKSAIESLKSLLLLCIKHPEFSIVNNILIEKQLSMFNVPGLELKEYNEWKNIKLNNNTVRVSLDAKPILILEAQNIVQGKGYFNRNGELENRTRYLVYRNMFDVTQTNAYEIGYKSEDTGGKYTEVDYKALIAYLKKKFPGICISSENFDKDSVEILCRFVSRRYLKGDICGAAMLEFLLISTLGFDAELEVSKVLLLDYKQITKTFGNVYTAYREIIKVLR